MSLPVPPPVTLIAPEIDADVVIRHPGDREDAPIVLLLHGLGSHEGDLAGLAPDLPRGATYLSLRGIHRSGPGFAWLEHPIDPTRPEALQTSAAAVEDFIRALDAPVVGAIGFSQGGILALQLLRRDPRALDWVVQLSGAPFPAPMPGDAALAAVRPPVLWGHGGLDPLFGPEREDAVRAFLQEHTAVEEVRRPYLGHGVDQEEITRIAAFIERRLAEHAG